MKVYISIILKKNIKYITQFLISELLEEDD